MAHLQQQPGSPESTRSFRLDEQQQRFFECFGFLCLRGLFSTTEMSAISAGFEEVFEGYEDPGRDDVMLIKTSPLHTDDKRHENPRRYSIMNFVERSPHMAWLNDDPRITGIAHDLIGAEFETFPSDGSLFFCETSWHPDTYQTRMEQFHIKLSLYLEPLEASTGAIRFIPGSHFYRGGYARLLRQHLCNGTGPIRESLNIEPEEVPSFTLETRPGDLVVWNYRTIHASFGGAPRRRLISLNFREPSAPFEAKEAQQQAGN